MTYSAFEEIRQLPPTPSTNKNKVDPPETIREPSENKLEVPDDIDVSNDPLLAAVLQFEREQRTTTEWKTPNKYFGSIRYVHPHSLADEAGFCDCDRIISFGNITVDSFKDLNQFAEYYESCRGSTIEAVVGRNIGERYQQFVLSFQVPTDPSVHLG